MKIMLDAGHGPNTLGKRSPDGIKEFEFNREIAKEMRKELEKYEGVTVYFAHDDKRDVPLKERTNKANSLKVDAYISLHINAASDGRMGDYGGIETYVYVTRPKTASALAQKIQSALIKATGLRDRGVKTANFHVLRETKMPAVLVEHGFMDSKTDLPKLKTPSFLKLMGKTNATSVAEFYKLKRKQESTPDNKPPAEKTPTEKPSTGKPPAETPSSTKLYKVQVGAFSNRKNAERLAEELKKKGYETFIKEE